MKRARAITLIIVYCALLAKTSSCHNVVANRNDTLTRTHGQASKQAGAELPVNHRMEWEDVPRLVTNGTQEKPLTPTVASTRDALPFNVDFVEQPDQFEAGQSFFMPTLRAPPPVVAYKPAASLAPDNDDSPRWSVAAGEFRPTGTPNQSLHVTTTHGAPAVQPVQPGGLALIKFDDDDSESSNSSNRFTISTLAPPAPAAHAGSESALAPAGVPDARALRTQLELELERSLAEQRKLVLLLGRQLEQQPSQSTGSASSIGRREGFVPLRQTSGYIRGQVPANHIVRHPNHRQASSSPRLPITKLPPAQQGQELLLALPRSSPLAPVMSAAGGASAPLATSTDGARLSSHSQLAPSTTTGMYAHQEPQYYYTLDGVTAERTKYGHSFGALKPTRDDDQDQPGGELDPDAEVDAGAETPPLLDWGHAQAAASGAVDDYETAPEARRQWPRAAAAAPADTFDPYQHQLFSSHIPIIYSQEGHTSRSKSHRPPPPPHAPRARRPTYETSNFGSLTSAPAMGLRWPGPAAAESSAVAPLARFRDYHHRNTYEVSPRLVPSASHKVIHIHTKEEKKGHHGKFLWPILGGGLTMLMGFLIISNLLLSIPLLAMGASSLLGHGGYHTQQLVPVYNLSSLTRPPAGRRRKRRWARAELVARQRDRIQFASLLRRVMASFAIRNKCRAPQGGASTAATAALL